MNTKNNNFTPISRLTALWALSESGLGGIMHTLKIPFTGFIVGGFAVIIISLIAHFSNNNFRIIIQSTILVLLIKAGVSPQSPLPAYVAVGFQGLLGAILFSTIKNFKVVAIVFGFFALIESAIQQILIATLLFGKSIWIAIDLFVQGVLKDFNLPTDFSFSTWFVLSYLIIYAGWGIYLGVFSGRLPRKLMLRSVAVEEQYQLLKISAASISSPEKKKKKGLIVLVLLLLFIVSIFFLEGYFSKAIYVVLRTIAILLFVFFVLKPIFLSLLQKANKKRTAELETILTQLPGLGNLVKPSMQIAGEKNKGIAKYKEFVFVLIVLSLMNRSPTQN